MDLQSLKQARLLRQFDPLIYKTLNRLGLRSNHSDFEDIAQELRIRMLVIYDSFQGDAFEDDKAMFAAYAGRGLYWYGRDLLRDFYKYRPILGSDQELLAYPEDGEFDQADNKLVVEDFLEKAQAELDGRDYQLLRLLLAQSFNTQEIAERFNVSSRTIRTWKSSLQDKIKKLFPEMTSTLDA